MHKRRLWICCPQLGGAKHECKATRSVSGGIRHRVGVHANVNQFNNPLLGYNETLLATVTLTNLADAVDSYPLMLDFSRDLGINEDFFLDINGTTLDLEIMFVPSRVLVIPEPSTAAFVIISLLTLFGWRLMNRQR